MSIVQVLDGHSHGVSYFSWSPDSSKLAVCGPEECPDVRNFIFLEPQHGSLFVVCVLVLFQWLFLDQIRHKTKDTIRVTRKNSPK